MDDAVYVRASLGVKKWPCSASWSTKGFVFGYFSEQGNSLLVFR